MKTIRNTALFLLFIIASHGAIADPPDGHPPCDPDALVGVWRVGDIGTGNTVWPGQQIALARSGHEFEAGGYHITEYTMVGMGFGELNEGMAFGLCHHDEDDTNSMYIAYSVVSSGGSNYLAAMTPHALKPDGSKPDFEDVACKNVENPDICAKYFEARQGRFLSVRTINVEMEVTAMSDTSDFVSTALDRLKPSDIGMGHSHGGSGKS